jgi:hypothetical protein
MKTKHQPDRQGAIPNTPPGAFLLQWLWIIESDNV